uniref:Uncharacterized protein n=1 Tax=Romanomermis culicivorax TaxID=13658 RepID=A0A915K6Z1_ROMCU
MYAHNLEEHLKSHQVLRSQILPELQYVAGSPEIQERRRKSRIFKICCENELSLNIFSCCCAFRIFGFAFERAALLKQAALLNRLAFEPAALLTPMLELWLIYTSSGFQVINGFSDGTERNAIDTK